MGTLTYTDLEGGAPTVSWRGREFVTTVPVEVDAEKDRDLIEAAKGNRFFAYDEGGSEPSYDETIVGKGEQAARDGKKRSIPPAYRGDDKRDQAEAWLFGFDKVPPSNDPYTDEIDTTDVRTKATSEAPAAPTSPTQVLANEKAGDDDKKGANSGKASA